jgi:hypothetical protein
MEERLRIGYEKILSRSGGSKEAECADRKKRRERTVKL